MSLLGPDGVAARVADLQARIDALSPRPQLDTSGTRSGSAGEPFASILGGKLNQDLPVDPTAALSGAIGAGGSGDLRAMATAAAERNGVPADLFQALIDQESGWNPKATSHAGAKGLCQLMDDTAKGLGVTNPYDPAQSLEGGARYLRQMLDKNGGNTVRALASYNAGPGRIKNSAPADWPAETKGYVKSILGRLGSAA